MVCPSGQTKTGIFEKGLILLNSFCYASSMDIFLNSYPTFAAVNKNSAINDPALGRPITMYFFIKYSFQGGINLK